MKQHLDRSTVGSGSGTAGRGPVGVAGDSAVREVVQMPEAFVGVLSHELRTPVTTIYGASKVLSRTASRITSRQRRQLLADIEAEAERLFRLVEDLLVLARFESPEAPAMRHEPALLQRVLPALLEQERGRWPLHEFRLDVPLGLPAIAADRTGVEQVVRNLLGNAAKYSPLGSVVELTAHDAETEVEVQVLDEGRGFPPEEASRLFELFYRSPSTSRTIGGAGIGLFVCRRLVEAMGGRIWARPRPAGGAEFGFALPVLSEEEP